MDDGADRRHGPTQSQQARPGGGRRDAGLPAGSGSTCELVRAEAAGPARRGWLDRLRPGRRLVLLLADRAGRRRHAVPRSDTVTGRRRPPGSTTSGATSSASAVAAGTGSPSTSTTARTSPCPRSVTPTAPIPWSTGRSWIRAARPATSSRDDVHRRRSRTDGPARRPAPTYPAGLVDRRSRRRSASSTSCRPSPARSSTRGRRPASCIGRGRRWSERPAGVTRSWVARRTWS